MSATQRILLVDDDELKRYATTRLLRREGFTVLEAQSGQEALALLDQEPDLVILDVKLPDLDGFEVARRIKANPRTVALPVLHLSATFVRGEHRARGLDAGADGYLTYPVEPVVLVAQVRALLRVRQAERERAELLVRERHAREQAERLQARFHLLAEVGGALTSSLDAPKLLSELGARLVPGAADLCLFVLLDEGGGATVLGARHRDAGVEPRLHALERHLPRLPDLDGGWVQVLRTGRSQILHAGTPAGLGELGTTPEERALWAGLGLGTVVAAPLRVGAELLGALVLGVEPSRPEVGPDDVLLVEDVGRRAGVVLENARLFTVNQRERERVEEANRTKDEFLATVSHELRTPLSAILGWAQLLRMGRLSDEKRERALETIERNARAQTQLIDDLLDISRIVTGKTRLQVRAVDPRLLLESVVESARPAAEAKRITLETDFDPGAQTLLADPDRLQQVVWNLVSNALKFSGPGARIQLRLRRADDAVEISVQDTGKGISRDFLPHVFERFRQAEGSTSRSYGGMGLGLAIVRHLVELHGGVVRADSDGEGKGATFTVRLPVSSQVKAEPALGLPREPRPHVSLTSPPALNGLRILVVDDEPDSLELLKQLLEQCGATVFAARSADEGFTALEAHRPDLIVSDIGMPGEDGYAFLRRVRGLRVDRGGRTPALALTAYARHEDRVRALHAGFQLHVSKPVIPSELLASVVSLVEPTRRSEATAAPDGAETPPQS